MPRVTRTRQAKADLIELYVGLARYSKPVAVKLRDDIEQAFQFLARSPRTGTERTDLLPELFSRAVSRRVIVYYRITDNGIEVQRVIDGRRKVDPSMFEG